MPSSTVKVEVKCDYCEDGVSMKPYRDYLKTRKTVPKDCCRKRTCMVKKSEESNLITYGVKNINETEESKELRRKMFQTPIEEVVKLAFSKGINILNTEDYQNDRTRLKVICEYHQEEGIQETNFANIKKNKNCCIHINKEIVKGVPRLSGKEAIKRFEDVGLIPLFSESDYLSNSTPLPFLCPIHQESGTKYKTIGNLASSSSCNECRSEKISKSRRKDLKNIEEMFTIREVMPLNLSEYKNRETKMNFICPIHNFEDQNTTLEILRNVKVPCKFCREENSLTTLNKRLRSSVGSWVDTVKEKDNYKCVLTGSDLYEVHHTYSYNSIISDALNKLEINRKSEYTPQEIIAIKKEVKEMHDVNKGICIHPELHALFHKIYTKFNNTPEQFEEFSIRYKNNEFNIKAHL